MKKADLAQALGISASMVSRLSKRGMPTDCVERAQRWRKRHIETGRMKGVRYDPKQQESQRAAMQAAIGEAVRAATSQAGPHLRDGLGLMDEAIFALQRHRVQAAPGLAQALDDLHGHFMALVVGRCGGLDAAHLHWWHWANLLPAEVGESEAVNTHLEAACLEPLTLQAFHSTLTQVEQVPMELLRVNFEALSPKIHSI